MTVIRCLDSSAWLAYYLAASEHVKTIIDSEGHLITSALCLFEIKKRLLTMKKEHARFLTFIRERSIIIPIDKEIAEKAADIAVEKKLAAMDALIYATAIVKNAELVTGDNDFRGFDGVKIIS